MKIVKY